MHLLALFFAVSLSQKPESTILRLYHDFAWEAVVAEPQSPDDEFNSQPPAVLRKYLDEHLVSLLLADRECAKKEGLCKLDFTLLWDSQDPSAYELKISPADASNIVRVEFLHAPGGKKTTIRYKMVKTADGWRIADIVYSETSLTKLLK